MEYPLKNACHGLQSWQLLFLLNIHLLFQFNSLSVLKASRLRGSTAMIKYHPQTTWEWKVLFYPTVRIPSFTEIRAEDNASTVTEFLLLGFSDLPNLQGILFGMFSIIYLIILVGNSFIIVITRIDPALQKPMYFFLANFSSLEICYVSVTVPRILFNIWTQDRNISVLACAVHLLPFVQDSLALLAQSLV